MKHMLRNTTYAFLSVAIIGLLAAGCGSGQFHLYDPIDTGSEIESGADAGTVFEILGTTIDKTSDGEITFEFDCEALEQALRIEGSARNVATNAAVPTEWTYDDSLVEGVRRCRGTLRPLTRWPNCADIEGVVEVELTQASAVGAMAAEETQVVRAAAQLQTICTGVRSARTYNEALDYRRLGDAAYQSSLTNTGGDDQATIERLDNRSANVFTEALTRTVEDSYVDSANATYDRLNYSVANDGTANLSAIGQQDTIARRVKLDAENFANANVAEYEVLDAETRYTDSAFDSAGNEYLVGYSISGLAGLPTSFVQIRDASGTLIDTFSYPENADMQYIKRIEIYDGNYYMMYTFDGMPDSVLPLVAYSTAAEMAEFRSGAVADLAYTEVELDTVAAGGAFRDMVKTNEGIALVGEYITMGGGEQAVIFYRNPLLATMDAGAIESYRAVEGTFDNAYLTAVDRDVNAVAEEKLVAVANVDGNDAIIKVGLNGFDYADKVDMCLSIESMELKSVSIDQDSLIYAAGVETDPITGETFSATAIADRNGYIFGRSTIDFKTNFNLSVEDIAEEARPDPGPLPGI
jgi:hypothetical protein